MQGLRRRMSLMMRSRMRRWNWLRSERNESGSEESQLKLLIGEKSGALEMIGEMRMVLERVGLAGERVGLKATVVERVWAMTEHQKCMFW